MAQHTVHLQHIRPSYSYDTKGLVFPSGFVHLAQYSMRLWRDAFRARLTARGVLDDVSGYTVSDVFTFEHTNMVGYFFIVRDNTNGAEWVFGMPHNKAAGAAAITALLGGTQAVYRAHVKNAGSTSHAYGSQALVMFYNPDITTATISSSVAFDDAAALTFTAGDDQAGGFAVNTSAGLTKFRPAHAPYGVSFDVTTNTWVSSCMTLDDVHGIGAYVVESASPKGEKVMVVTGNNLVPATGSDTRLQYLAHWQADHSVNAGEAYAFDSAGALQTYKYDLGTVLTFADATLEEAATRRYNWRVIELVNGSSSAGTKGALPKEAVVVIGAGGPIDGPMTRHWPFTFGDRTMVKYGDRWAVPHQAGAPLCPFGLPFELRE